MDKDLIALLAFEQRQQEEIAALKVAENGSMGRENDAPPNFKPSFIVRPDGVNKCDSPPPTSNRLGLILPPADCLARVETDEAVYFVCKQNLVIGRETGHSPADVSFKETFVSRAHLELFYAEDGWRFKCNGKNGIILNDILLNKGLGDTILPPECKLKFPSTDIEFKFSSKFPVFLPTNLASYDNVYANSNSNHVKDGFSNSAIIPPEPDHTNCVLRLPSPLTVDTGDKNEPRSDGCFEQDPEESSADSGENNFADNNDDREGKPPYSYAQLIVQAISSTPDRQLTLAGIYAYITKHYAYYRTCDKGWQNSIRHNLSLCRHFVRIPRSQDEPGKGSFWRIDPICEAKQVQQAFKKRRQGKGGSCLNAATSSASCIISASSSSNTSPPCYLFNENAKTRSGSAPVSPTSAASCLPSGSLAVLKRGSLPAVGYLAGLNRPLSDINSSIAEAFSPQSSSPYGGGDSRRFSQTSSITDESSAECVFIGQHRRCSPDEIKMAKTEHKSNATSPNRTGTIPTSLVLPVISEKTRNSLLERHYQKGAAANCNEPSNQSTGNSPKNNGALALSNDPPKIIAACPPRRNTAYSPQINGNGSRFISQSAPSSPKSFNKANVVEQETADLDSGRVHHHSGGTFSVRRNATDGRQRLQICYSRPWYVEVSTSDTSALEKLAQESRSRQNSGHHAQGGAAPAVASSLYRGSSVGGSKSLSTTPVRELLAAGAKSLARSIDGEGTMGSGVNLGAASMATSKPFALGVGGGLTSREYNNGKRLETLKQRSTGGAKLPHFTSSLVRNDAPKATTMVTAAHHKQPHQHLQQQPISIAPAPGAQAASMAAAANFLQQRSAPASPLDAAAALSLQAALTLGAQAAASSSTNPYSAILNNASASLVSNLMAPILLQNYLPLVASTGLIGASGLLQHSQPQQSNPPNLMNYSFPHSLSSLNNALNALNGSTAGLLTATGPFSSNSHSLSTGSAFGLVGMGTNPDTSLNLNAAVVNSAIKRTFPGAEPPPLTKIIKRE